MLVQINVLWLVSIVALDCGAAPRIGRVFKHEVIFLYDAISFCFSLNDKSQVCTPLWLAVPQKVVLKAEKRFSIHTWHLTVATYPMPQTCWSSVSL